MTIYRYNWEAWINNKLIKGGVVELNYDEMMECHGSHRLPQLVIEWNRRAEFQFNLPEINNQPRILWKYFL